MPISVVQEDEEMGAEETSFVHVWLSVLELMHDVGQQSTTVVRVETSLWGILALEMRVGRL
jgi:hypothetical protein